MNNNYIFKYIFIGDSCVGKTSIINRFLHNNFSNYYDPTLCLDFGIYSTKINNDNIKIQIWDTAGQENFKSIIRSYYRNADCCFLVFDITNKKSFENIEEWKREVMTYTNKDPLFILIGNKSDLSYDRKVTIDEILEFSKNNNMKYYEISAKNDMNIRDIFTETIKFIYEDKKKLYIENINVIKQYNQINKINTQKKSCC